MKYSTPLVRTSISLDQHTLDLMAELAGTLSVSKSEVVRQAIRKLKEAENSKARRPSPLEALDRLQKGEGITVEEAEAWKAEITAERMAKRYWWEE